MRKPIRRGKVMSEINITPFTDVVLVLLVIFMITTPLFVHSHIKIKLPKAAKAESSSEKNLTIKISQDGAIYLNEKPIGIDALEDELKARVASDPEAAVVINGDKNIQYKEVIKVLDITKRSGVKKLALGVEMQAKNSKEGNE